MGKVNELIQRFLGEPARNLMHAMYDDYVEANVRFRSRSGMKTFIVRRQLAKCCDWCAGLAGIYESDKAPDGVYQRHDNCKCMVTFRNEKGIYTDAWSKKEYDTQKKARIEKLKEIDNESRAQMPAESLNALKFQGGNGTLNIEIDELVACLKDARTGELVETEAYKITDRNALKKFNEASGWNVNWYDLAKDNEIYAVSVKGEEMIQGLIAFQYDEEAKGMYLNRISSAPWNVKKHSGGTQRYKGVGGHLVAIAAEKTLEKDAAGWMYGFAKNEALVKHYVEVFHAEYFPVRHPYQVIIDTPALHELLETYNYEWR